MIVKVFRHKSCDKLYVSGWLTDIINEYSIKKRWRIVRVMPCLVYSVVTDDLGVYMSGGMIHTVSAQNNWQKDQIIKKIHFI